MTEKWAQVLNDRLKDHEWLAADQYSIADIANFSWVGPCADAIPDNGACCCSGYCSVRGGGGGGVGGGVAWPPVRVLSCMASACCMHKHCRGGCRGPRMA